MLDEMHFGGGGGVFFFFFNINTWNPTIRRSIWVFVLFEERHLNRLETKRLLFMPLKLVFENKIWSMDINW